MVLGLLVVAAAAIASATSLHAESSSSAMRALEADESMDLKMRPVAKVLKMLKDMKAELEKELADDEEVHEMLSCWCKTNDEEKSKAISEAKIKIEGLESSIAEFGAKIAELQETIGTTRQKLIDDKKALDTATAMRMKEIKEFHKEETDLIEAIQAAKQALLVLGRHHAGLTQIKAAVKGLTNVNMQLLSMALKPDQRTVFQGFMNDVKKGKLNFLDTSQPVNVNSYNPQSGQIFGILQQLKEDFEKNLAEIQKQEADAQASYDELKVAKEAELAASKKAKEMAEADEAEFREKKAQAEEDRTDTKDQLALDEEFLYNLRKQCTESEKEYQERRKSRLEEITACADVIGWLNSDDAFELFGKALGFMQLRVQTQRKSQRERAVDLLQKAATKLANPELVLLAMNVQRESFDKVIAAIDQMRAELKKQMADEVKEHDWCIAELDKNTLAMDAKDHEKTTLQSRLEEIAARLEALEKEIKELTAAIAEMQKQMGRASATREKENAEYQTAVMDQRLTQQILQKAMERMQQVYALYQKKTQYHPHSDEAGSYSSILSLVQQPGAPHIQTSGTDTDPGNGPARFKKYEQNAGGSKVIAMIKAIIEDSKKTEDEVEFAEREAQGEYENFMKDSNKSIKKMSEAMANKNEEKSKLEQEQVMTKEDFDSAVTELNNLYEQKTDLHGSCDFIIKNFSVRQDARQQELNALLEVKGILGGMDK